VIRRGDVVTVVLPREYGKPRPAVVVQSDLYQGLPTLIVCPATTEVRDDAPNFRLTIQPSEMNGLQYRSQLMVDKLSPIARTRIGKVIGHVEAESLERLDAAISALLGLA
jgi:mRNA interferase MazF